MYVQHMLENGHRALSLAAVLRLLPKNVFKVVSKVPFHTCLCAYCENFKLALLAAVYTGVKGLPQSITEAAMLSTCSMTHTAQESKTDIFLNCKHECLKQKCKKCANKFAQVISQANPKMNLEKKVIYHQWEGVYGDDGQGSHIKTNYCKMQKSGTLVELLGLLKLQVIKLPEHIFQSKW